MAKIQQYDFKCDNPERLDLLLRKKIPEAIGSSDVAASNSKIRRLIIAGAVSVDGRQIRVPSFSVRKNSTVNVIIDDDKFFFQKQNDDIKFEVTEKSVLFEDDYIILINKPAHFPTEKTLVQERDNLHATVIRYLHGKNPSLRNPPYVGIMHRLDRETSGVILFTKQRSVNAPIHAMFESESLDSSTSKNKLERPVHKTYLAVVDLPKKLPQNKFSVENYLGRISPKSSAGKWGIVPKERDGKIARTDFEIASVKNNRLYLYAHPLTGRTHQIRVHLSGLSMPIIGDELYGGSENNRMLLHAFRLEFTHPVTGEKMNIFAPEPEDFI